MITIRLTTTAVLLGLCALLATPPLAADRDDDRGEKMLRKAPPAREASGGTEKRIRTQPERDHRVAPPPQPRVVPAPKPPVAQPPRPQVRDHREPEKKLRTQPKPPSPVHREPPRLIPPPKPPPGYVIDKRHSHNHYYPPRGHLVPVPPVGARVIIHRGVHYYYHSGVWYRPSGPRFVVVLPPRGIIVPFLPPFFTIVWYGAVPYYYADGVYYLWYPEHRYYAVAEPPPESEVREQPAGSDELFIYPQRGQSEAQQAQDRYECHRWAADQTSFDPSLPGGNVSESQYAAKRADYRRAMKACLEARGYSVQ
jgi:hypothetical protein